MARNVLRAMLCARVGGHCSSIESKPTEAAVILNKDNGATVPSFLGIYAVA